MNQIFKQKTSYLWYMVSSYNNTTLSQMRYILKLQYNKTQTYTPQFSVFTICVGHYFVIFIGVNPMFLQMLFSVQNALPCWARRKKWSSYTVTFQELQKILSDSKIISSMVLLHSTLHIPLLYHISYSCNYISCLSL